jgi:hypothetical protein
VAKEDDGNHNGADSIKPENDKSLSFFEHTCEIHPPFHIADIKQDLENTEMHVYVEYDKSLGFTSICCGEKDSKIDHVEPRIWRVPDFQKFKSFIHMDVPFVKCPKCDSVKETKLPMGRNPIRF